MSLCNREASVVRLSVRPSVCKLCANRFFYHKRDSIATIKLAHDGPQTGLHPGCAQGQGQGQKSRYTGTSVMSWNVWYTVRSHVLSLHALTLWNTLILSFQIQYKYQSAVYWNELLRHWRSGLYFLFPFLYNLFFDFNIQRKARMTRFRARKCLLAVSVMIDMFAIIIFVTADDRRTLLKLCRSNSYFLYCFVDLFGVIKIDCHWKI